MGHILLFSRGLDPANVAEEDLPVALFNFFEVYEQAERDGDKFYITEKDSSAEFNSGHSLIYAFCSPDELREYAPLKNVPAQVLELFTTFRAIIASPILSSDPEFTAKPEPKANAGMKVDNAPLPYLCDKATHRNWKTNFYRLNPAEIDWTNAAGNLFPNSSVICECFERELTLHGYSGGIPKSLTELCDLFYTYVIKRKPDREKEAYFQKIGTEICLANYYTYEDKLSAKEQKICGSLRRIFSIECNRHLQYLSIDFEGGMFELHDSRGHHQGEFRWDGKNNGNPDPTGHHDLYALR